MIAEIVREPARLAELRPAWNRLWAESRLPNPDSRWEIIELHHASFARQADLVAVVVRDSDDRLVAGLPLLETREHGLFRVLRTLGNPWHQCGELLIAPEVCDNAVYVALIAGLQKLRASHLWCDWIQINREEWQALIAAAAEQSWGIQQQQRFEVGLTCLPELWSAFEGALSKNVRKKARSELKKIEQLGAVELDVVANVEESKLSQRLDEALDIEMNSWKGCEDSAIRCHPTIERFYTEWARHLNDCSLFRLYVLRLDGVAIAFDMGGVAAGCYRSQKISYRSEFAPLSPGHVLNQLLIRHLMAEGTIHAIDTVGPLNEATARWSNKRYSIGRLVLAPDSWLKNVAGRSLVTMLNVRGSLNRSLGR